MVKDSRLSPKKSTALLVALLLSQHLTPADCFHQQNHRRRSRPLGFCSDASSTMTTTTNSIHSLLQDDDTATTTRKTPPLQHEHRLPSWLSKSQAHLAETNLRTLQTSMASDSSFFTSNESRKLLLALEQASAGDGHKLAGAAAFLTILVETMEMGLNALIAAAFHYCTCLDARTQSAHWQWPQVSEQQKHNIDCFGPHVAAIVQDAGHLKQLEMVASSLEHTAPTSTNPAQADNWRKLLVSETSDWRALAIRCGACLYRLKGCTPDTVEATIVGRQALHVYAPLASRLGLHRLKNELENLAFQIVYPRQYQKVDSVLQGESKQEMQQVLQQIRQDVEVVLQQDETFSDLVQDYTVTARVKEPYSLWKKMLRDGYEHVLQVPDALALRIVLNAKKLSPNEPADVTRPRERALCYYAQRLCAEHYHPLPHNPRFKDYMAHPKPNGYQSLHYTAETSDGWTCEFQVRSGEMHQVAEFGVASHAEYKLASSSSKQQEPQVHMEQNGRPLDLESSASTTPVVCRQMWHGAAAPTPHSWDASPASSEEAFSWQNQPRTDRIRARTARLEPYLQALTATQLDLTTQVFLFVNGQVTALPAGTQVGDVSKDGYLELNGVSNVSVTQCLHNGDVLNVRTAPSMVAM